MQTKVGKTEYEEKLVQLLKNVKEPVSIDFVAFNLRLSWVTTRALLFTLALQGKIKFMKTSKSWVFWLEHAKELQTENRVHAQATIQTAVPRQKWQPPKNTFPGSPTALPL